MVKGKRE